MAIVDIPDKNIRLTDPALIRETLAGVGIDYERWDAKESRVSPDASEAEILEAYEPEIETLKRSGGYVTADVINIVPTTPNLEAMLGKFNKEHWHDEDEIRFIVKGHGLFHIAPKDGPVVSVEMEAGDLIRVPRGTLHWFDLCADRMVRAIRLFQDPAGWTPHYTESGIDNRYQPLCFGPDIFPAGDQSI
ncbi:MAG: cupin domain-containing protein [Acidobacteria bacterium]|nr:cupin domain-containing protein [Acidobacteriota bacterium]MBK8150233.1 cupin domain-containing protein [Acidobacteriota bacterium]MBK8809981.1 cupin domain-containing protein [Acidobacteriota bacterium]